MNGERKSDESERKFPILNISAVALRLSNNCFRSTDPHCFVLSVGWRPNNEWQRDYVENGRRLGKQYDVLSCNYVRCSGRIQHFTRGVRLNESKNKII